VRDASSKSKSESGEETNPTPTDSRKSLRHQDSFGATAGEDVPAPGYIQSLINRIVNNVNIVMNNLILKFVEDDIVLSINMKSAECYSVNYNWQKSFIDLTPEELVLRRLISVSDLTVCLDKRNTTGKIEAYQEPLLYKCSVACRMHMVYESLTSKLPQRVKFSFLCHQFDMSLTDAQLPMFARLYELFVAIWYEGYGINAHPSSLSCVAPSTENPSPFDVTESTAEPEAKDDEREGNPDGWMSWAWSYVPPILPTEDDEEYEDDDARLVPQVPPEPPTVSLGFYVDKGTINFKVTLAVHNSPLYGPQKLVFRPILTLLGEGSSMEITTKGDLIKGERGIRG
jgi:vacuolar protein sorting-associated protein 13B